MDSVVAAEAATGPQIFAENVMEIAVPPTTRPASPGCPTWPSPAVKVALCQPQVPCGATAQQVFDQRRSSR